MFWRGEFRSEKVLLLLLVLLLLKFGESTSLEIKVICNLRNMTNTEFKAM